MEVRGVKIKALGRGSYGVVHLVATTSPCSRLYAVKSASYAKSFSLQKEREILKKFIGCPNVVRFCGAFTTMEPDQGKVYNLFLEYASGGSLLDLMNKNGGKIPECDVKGCARMILEGLVDIHERGYIHSDLKPANILVFPSQIGCGLNTTLKIADFGLAKQYGEIDIPQLWEYGFRGTAAYMSPESVIGEISGALDIWSLGCIIVEMISGKRPWNCRNLKDLRNKLLNGESPKIPENMSSTGKDFLKMCFARDPNQRWTANMLLNHPFVLPEFSLFSYGGPPKLITSSLTSTNFQDVKSFKPTKNTPEEFSFFSYGGPPKVINSSLCSTKNSLDRFNLFSCGGPPKPIPSTLASTKNSSDQFNLFSYGSPLNPITSSLSLTNFQGNKSFQHTKNTPKEFSFFSYGGPPKVLNSSLCSTKNSSDIFSLFSYGGPLKPIPSTLASTKNFPDQLSLSSYGRDMFENI